MSKQFSVEVGCKKVKHARMTDGSPKHSRLTLSIQTAYAKKALKNSSSLIVGSVHKLAFFGTAAAIVTKRRKFLINPYRST